MRSLQQLVGAIESLRGAARIPGCSVAAVDHNGVIWSHGWGYADVVKEQPADPLTVYHLFSGTKLFTATAILQLVDRGQLDLDAKLGTYLPDLPQVHEIPLRGLLSHASGLKDTLTGFLAVYFPGSDPPTTAEALAGYDLQPRGAPEQNVRYANVNYALLGEIVSRVSGLPYRDYVRQRILSPLSSDADFDVSHFDGTRLATGYLSRWDPTRILLRFLMPSVSRRIYRERTRKGLIALHDYNLSTASAGGLIGSVGSFAPFLQSQLNGGRPLLSVATAERMQTLIAKGRAGIESKIGVGLGWKVGVAGSRRFLNHEGSGAGFTSELRLYPDEGLGIVVLTNKSSLSKTMRVAHEVCERICDNREVLR